MSDDRILELLSAAADGELGGDERAELQRLLQESSDARRIEADLRRMELLLRSVPAEDPPASLHRRIMAGVPRASAGRNPPVRSWLRYLTPVPALGYGLAAAAGVLLAAAFYELQPATHEPPDIDQLVGTMAPERHLPEPDVLDSYRLQTTDVESLVQLRRHNGALILGIETNTAVPVEIAVDFASTGLRLDALMQDEPLESLALAGQVLRIRALGRRKVTALLRRQSDAAAAGTGGIGLEFSSDGKVLRHGSLGPSGSEQAP